MGTVDLAKQIRKFERKKEWAKCRILLETYRDKIIERDPKTQEAVLKLLAANCYKTFDYISAEMYYRQAYEVMKSPDILQGVAVSLLQQGRLVEGMGLYHNRRHLAEWKSFLEILRNTNLPRLDRWEELEGRNLLVVYEQGFGDEILFSRVIHLALCHCKSIFWITSEPTAALFRASLSFTGDLTVVGADASQFPYGIVPKKCDSYVTLADLFVMFVNEHKRPPPLNLFRISPRQSEGDHPRVGYTFSPGVMAINTEDRIVPIGIFKQLARYNSMYSFQVDTETGIGEQMHHKVTNFLDTANWLAGMDCVVTCDTALAHVGLILHKPTAIIYSDYMDWRWKTGLYPRVKLLSYKQRDFWPRLNDFIEESTP